MPAIYHNDLSDLRELVIGNSSVEIVDWQGRKALKLNGLAVIPDLTIEEGRIEVQIGSDGAAYPGIAFRIQDVLNFELAYAQPHTSGKWDALQYDPVFHGSNTWQLYHGQAYQKSTGVPLWDWFKFSVSFKDQMASVQVGEQDPLVVSRLAHTNRTGLIGIWTYLPAYFCDFCVFGQALPIVAGSTGEKIADTSNTVMEWFMDGFGKVTCESNGVLNLNRYLPTSVGEVKLYRQIEAPDEGEIEISFGYSDKLVLKMDDDIIFSGENLYKSSPAWEDRGYVEKSTRVLHRLTPGRHKLIAIISVTEFFGWGLSVALMGSQIRLLPAYSG